MKYIIGVDIGTTGCKVCLYDQDLELEVRSYRTYDIISDQIGFAEEDPNIWFSRIKECIKECMVESKINEDGVIAIGISCTNGIVPVDKEGNNLYNAIMQIDTRSEKQADYIRNHISEEMILAITGNRVALGTFSAPVILWIKENKREIYDKTHKFLSPSGYIVQKLTGEFTFDHTRASTTLLYDIKNKVWSQELLNNLDIDNNKLPEIFNSYDVVGTLKNEVAKEIGLSDKTKIIAGVMDSVAACVGIGSNNEDKPVLIIGTVARLCLPLNDKEFESKFLNTRYAFNIPYLSMTPVNGGGLSLRWYIENFLDEEVKMMESIDKDFYDYFEEQVGKIKAGSDSMIYLPYIVGERSPIWDPYARGVFFGVGLKTTKFHFYRAIMEGVAFAIRDNLEIYVDKYEKKIEKILISGGGSKSKIWSQIFADVLGLPIIIPTVVETETRGSAILAGYGVGLFSSNQFDLQEDVSVIKPNEKNFDLYGKMFNVYKDLYAKNKESFRLLRNV